MGVRAKAVGMNDSYTNILVHIVFSTKNREPLIASDVQPRLYAYLDGIIQEDLGRVLAIGGTEDHLHILAKVPPTMTLSDLVRHIKGSSSRWIEQQPWFDGGFGWQRGFAAFSVSQSQANAVRAYIRNQQEHHRKTSFQDELALMTRKHDVAAAQS